MLDREYTDRLEFHVLAKDNGSPQLTSTATVSMTVLDINDNRPVFGAHDSIFKVFENVTVGTVIGRIQASDADAGDYGTVFYRMETQNKDGKLEINNSTVSKD